MSDFFQLVVLSFLQGITEFLPISSSAHLIIIPKIFNWGSQGLLFDVSVHFGSLIAVTYYYFKNISSFKNIDNSVGYIDFKKIIIGSLPVLMIGFFFHDFIDHNLRTVEIIAITTILFAVPIIFLELTKNCKKNISEINNYDIFIIGLFQALALAPGTSRSAVIILAALLLGYNKKSAIIISIVLSFPVILLAMVYEVYAANGIFLNLLEFSYYLCAIFISFLTSYLVIKYFILYINRVGFIPYMIYRILLGIILLIFFI